MPKPYIPTRYHNLEFYYPTHLEDLQNSTELRLKRYMIDIAPRIPFGDLIPDCFATHMIEHIASYGFTPGNRCTYTEWEDWDLEFDDFVVDIFDFVQSEVARYQQSSTKSSRRELQDKFANAGSLISLLHMTGRSMGEISKDEIGEGQLFDSLEELIAWNDAIVVVGQRINNEFDTTDFIHTNPLYRDAVCSMEAGLAASRIVRFVFDSYPVREILDSDHL